MSANGGALPSLHGDVPYRRDVDGMRGVAVLLVVGFHAFPSLLRGGFIGVDVFFVISGYLITGIIIERARAGAFTFRDFYARRIRRIFPALMLVLACVLIWGWFELLPCDYAQLGENAAGGAAFVSNLVLLAQSGYFAAASDERPLLHLWSLGIEEQYYILWPALLWWSLTARLRIEWIAIGLALVSFALNVARVHGDASAAFYLPQTRFWELLCGAAWSAFAHRSLTGHPRGRRIPAEAGAVLMEARAWCGLVCLVAGMICINPDSIFPGWWAILPTAGSLLLIAAGPEAWLNRRVLSGRILVAFGLISYPLYLWHWPLLSLATLEEGQFPARNLRFMLVAAAIVLASLTYRWVERPIRMVKRGAPGVGALIALMMCVAMLGYLVHANKGFPERYPPAIRQIDAIAHANDHADAWRERSCFLELDQDAQAFSSCDAGRDARKPVILLWGDSLAAQLYPGYAEAFRADSSIMQRTAAACAPLFEDSFNERLPHCAAINDEIIRTIARLHPDRVVLAARWSVHDWRKLVKTVALLRSADVRHIDVVGPVPRWQGTLPRQLIKVMQRSASNSFPRRMSSGLESGFDAIEPALRGLARQLDINYLSPASVLCDGGGCLTATGPSPREITSFDYDHLSPAASVFVVRQFAEINADTVQPPRPHRP